MDSRRDNAAPAAAPRAAAVPSGENDFTALAVASGKGGVGKTMLSVALAYELSQNAPTLIIDLDFFNRGLTGLLRKGQVIRELESPDLLPEFNSAPSPAAGLSDEAGAPAQPDSSGRWELLSISDNLFTIRYPDLSTSDYAKIENMPIDTLAQSLADYIESVVKLCGVHFVVLDCHGGPDRTSFAACKIAQTTLLVSEPDRITLYGTLNFMRQLRDAGACSDEDIRLVFNKVVPSFTSPFLRRFYNSQLRDDFGGRPLLAMFPMEDYLTKAFEKNALLAKVFPESLLARKTRVYICDLLAQREPQRLSRHLTGMSQMERDITRNSLGGEPILLRNEFAVATIFSIAMVLMAAQVGSGSAVGLVGPETRALLEDFVSFFLNDPYFALFGLSWFMLTLFRSWMRRLTRATLFFARSGRRLSAALTALAKAAVVAPAVGLLGIFGLEVANAYRLDPSVVIAFAFCAAFLSEYYFYNIKREFSLRRYPQITRTERFANQIALFIPILIGTPIWLADF